MAILEQKEYIRFLQGWSSHLYFPRALPGNFTQTQTAVFANSNSKIYRTKSESKPKILVGEDNKISISEWQSNCIYARE